MHDECSGYEYISLYTMLCSLVVKTPHDGKNTFSSAWAIWSNHMVKLATITLLHVFLGIPRKRFLIKGPISLAETSPRLPQLISRGNSGDSGDQKMACALTQGDIAETSPEKVTTNSPGSRGDVSEMSSQLRRRLRQSLKWVKQHRGDVATSAPQRLLSLLGLQQVSETSPQSRTKLVSATSPQLMETSRRRLRDLLETGKSLY